MIFDYSQISTDKTPEENIKIIKSFLDDLVDRLNMQAADIEALKNKTESEGR